MLRNFDWLVQTRRVREDKKRSKASYRILVLINFRVNFNHTSPTVFETLPFFLYVFLFYSSLLSFLNNCLTIRKRLEMKSYFECMCDSDFLSAVIKPKYIFTNPTAYLLQICLPPSWICFSNADFILVVFF